MTRTIAIDSNNDIFIGSDGSLATALGLEAVMQACAQAAKTQLGELLFEVDLGLPNFEAVWNGAPNLSQFEAFLRRNLAQVPDVIGVQAVSVAIIGGVLQYRAEIQTIYGPGVING